MTRRQWLLRLGGGVALAGWSGVDLDAADLPPGVYDPSRDHLGHALAGHAVAVGGETELVQPRAATFQPAFFSRAEYPAILRLVALILGEATDAPIVHEIAVWIDLTVSDAAAVRAAARAFSPPNRTLAIHFYGAASVRKLEEFDAQQVMRQGLARLNRDNFLALAEPSQIAILKTISDDPFFTYLKELVIHGFYTSRAGLEELGYRGNAFYATPPGCEHLYG